MKKWNLPLTYAPKIPKVRDGTCTQTIRIGRKFSIGDLVSFHGWEGKPYRSRWSFKTPYWELIEVIDIWIVRSGLSIPDRLLYRWQYMDDIALLDGIDPPTGTELGDVLQRYHTIPVEGLEAQIIRWRYTP